jgi:hypothetical protein
MADFNPKGKHDDEKTVEKQCHEKPEKRDMMIDTNFEGEYDRRWGRSKCAHSLSRET